jgi:hypothetical protein
MAAVMVQAARKAARIVAAPAIFVGRAVMQAAERLIPQGAAEVGQALFTGNAYAPPGLTEKHGPPSMTQEAGVPAPAQVAAPSTGYGDRLNDLAARLPTKVNQQERGR